MRPGPSSPPATGDGRHARARGALPWLGLLLLAAAFGIDSHLDVRGRDLFSWMDPYPYYEFALGVLEGRERFDGFEIPSLFPFAVMPLLAVDPSVSGALWIHIAALLILLPLGRRSDWQ